MLRLRITTEWGYSPLIEELDYYLSKMTSVDFHKQMDIIGKISAELHLDSLAINEELQKNSIGYEYVNDSFSGVLWNLIDEHIEHNAENVSAAEEQVDNAHVNVIEHLKQAKG
jgi:hypothetical protein